MSSIIHGMYTNISGILELISYDLINDIKGEWYLSATSMHDTIRMALKEVISEEVGADCYATSIRAFQDDKPTRWLPEEEVVLRDRHAEIRSRYPHLLM